jgi:hypothetical protein
MANLAERETIRTSREQSILNIREKLLPSGWASLAQDAAARAFKRDSTIRTVIRSARMKLPNSLARARMAQHLVAARPSQFWPGHPFGFSLIIIHAQ